jgi:hypothetical protein
MQFSGSVIDFKTKENEFSAKKFDGESWVEFEIINNKPSAVKIKSICGKGDIRISIQLADRVESVTTGNCRIDFDNCTDGKYIIKATAKNAEDISIRYEFI